MNDILTVLIAGEQAGAIRQSPNGSLSFAYKSDYDIVPLSLSMPFGNGIYSDKVVRPFLFGLLPDSYEVRRSLGREYGVSPDNPFTLLACIGLDCPGAVQICSETVVDKAMENLGRLIPLSDQAIAMRLKQGRGSRAVRWETNNERWSLGGQQAKFALRQEGNSWHSCEGAAATTHIFKPGISDLRLSALNEYVCLKLAKQCGLQACEVSYQVFDGEPAIIATRYDRARSDDGQVRRLHQEDFCQVLGVLPENKYSEEGGPGANDVIRVCKQTGSQARKNIQQFIDMLFFNYLTGAPDAHAKNYSLLLGRDTAYLAPLYDVASLLPYAERPFEIKLAMGIAGENRVGRLSAHRLDKFVSINELDKYGLTGEILANRLAVLATKIPTALEEVLNENEAILDIDELGSRLLPLIEALCGRSLARLG